MTRIFVVGDLNLDILCKIRELADFNEEADISNLKFSLGGNASNLGYAAASLGLDVELLSAIGKDFSTSFLKNYLKRANVKLNLINSKGLNGYSIVLVNKNGEKAIYSGKGACGELTAKIIEKKLLPKIKPGDLIYFGGYFHLLKVHKGFPQLLKKIKRNGCTIAFDLCYDEFGKWKVNHLLKYIDLLFLNEIELEKVAKGKNKLQKIKFLIKNGAKNIILKKGKKGVTFYSKDRVVKEKAITAKVIDTTGAGDVFNAGFLYGKINQYSEKNCLRIANFVAWKKIQQTGLAIPSEKEIRNFLLGKNLLQLEIAKDYNGLSKRAASLIIEQVKKKPNSIIGIPGGSTPIGTYKELIRAFRNGKVDFSKAKFFGLDEYVGLGPNNKNSFAYVLNQNLLNRINVKRKNILFFNGLAKDLKRECRKFEKIFSKEGIDFLLLGLGKNCHIAFNEPGKAFNSKIHIAQLSGSTIKANSRFFKRKEQVPKKAITFGLKTIMNAKTILLIASGKKKADAVRRMVRGKPNSKCPASILQKHKNATVLIDKAAASSFK